MNASAAAVYQELQWGRRPRQVIPLHVPRGVPAHTAQLGELDHLELVTGECVSWPGARLTVGVPPGQKRRSLYVLAAEPVWCPPALRGTRIAKVVYVTSKGTRPVQRWHHLFLGVRPQLDAYVTGEARIARAGSQYTVEDERGIVG